MTRPIPHIDPDHLRALLDAPACVPPDEALIRAHAIVHHARRQQIVDRLCIGAALFAAAVFGVQCLRWWAL